MLSLRRRVSGFATPPRSRHSFSLIVVRWLHIGADPAVSVAGDGAPRDGVELTFDSGPGVQRCPVAELVAAGSSSESNRGPSHYE